MYYRHSIYVLYSDCTNCSTTIYCAAPLSLYCSSQSVLLLLTACSEIETQWGKSKKPRPVYMYYWVASFYFVSTKIDACMQYRASIEPVWECPEFFWWLRAKATLTRFWVSDWKVTVTAVSRVLAYAVQSRSTVHVRVTVVCNATSSLQTNLETDFELTWTVLHCKMQEHCCTYCCSLCEEPQDLTCPPPTQNLEYIYTVKMMCDTKAWLLSLNSHLNITHYFNRQTFCVKITHFLQPIAYSLIVNGHRYNSRFCKCVGGGTWVCIFVSAECARFFTQGATLW